MTFIIIMCFDRML